MDLLDELRFTVRSVFRSGGTGTVIVLTLALCLASASSVLTVADSLLLELLPYEDYEELVYVGLRLPTRDLEQIEISEPEYFDLSKQERVFDQVAALRNRDVNLTGGGRPERIRVQAITANTFSMLGIEPSRGRRFLSEEQGPNAGRVAVVSHRLWQERLGGEMEHRERSILFDGEPYRVIGIMPEGFRFGRAEAWIPSRVDPNRADRSDRWVVTMARLRPGMTVEVARRELGHVADRLERRFTETNPEYEGFDFLVQPVSETILRDLDTSILVLLGAVGLLLLVACANIGNLLAARYTARSSEMAIRATLGAGPGSLIRQILLEGSALGLFGGALGLVLGMWGVRTFLWVIPGRYVPAETEISMDWSVVVFGLAAAFSASVLFSAIPILQVSKLDLTATLQAGRPGSGIASETRRLRRSLVMFECALAICILIAAGLLVRSYRDLRSFDLGFEPQGVTTARIALPESRYPESYDTLGFYRKLVRRIEGSPEVLSCGVASDLPLHRTRQRAFAVVGPGVDSARTVGSAVTRVVSAGYFETLRIPLLAGRTFEERDRSDESPVVIVNEALADRSLAGADSLGRKIRLGETPGEGTVVTVVGIVGDVHQSSNLRESIGPEIYLPVAQHAREVRELAVLVRGSESSEAGVELIRREVLALDPQQPIYESRPMTDLVGEAVAPQRFAVLLVGIFAAVALVIAAGGLHALVAFSVGRRRREIGLRRALGAERTSVIGLVLRESMKPVGVGVILGSAGGVAGGKLLSSLIYGVRATDITVFVGVPLVFVVVALVATSIPTWKASRVDPLIALRSSEE